jgi:hypothetical protein
MDVGASSPLIMGAQFDGPLSLAASPDLMLESELLIKGNNIPNLTFSWSIFLFKVKKKKKKAFYGKYLR